MKLFFISESLNKFLPTKHPTQDSYQYGDCCYVIYKTAKNAVSKGIDDFKVIDGIVEIDNKEIAHSWIVRHGKIIDPTIEQFGNAQIRYNPPGSYKDEFTPLEYIKYMEDQYGEL